MWEQTGGSVQVSATAARPGTGGQALSNTRGFCAGTKCAPRAHLCTTGANASWRISRPPLRRAGQVEDWDVHHDILQGDATTGVEVEPRIIGRIGVEFVDLGNVLYDVR